MVKILSFMLTIILLFPSAAAKEMLRLPVMRALLIGCDQFVTQENLRPSAENNVEDIRQILQHDARGYQSIHTSINQPLDESAFRLLVRNSFQDAKENDISLFYISTHGDYRDDVEGRFRLLLSDGQQEYALTMAVLHSALAEIRGTKVLIIDTCNSGMLLNKGTEMNEFHSQFAGEGYKVLTSAGGNEQSYNWSSGVNHQHGGSYFLLALSRGLGPQGNYAADANRDGSITMSETYQYLLGNYGPSTPQMYPQQDEFVLLQYHREGTIYNSGHIFHVMFDATTLSADEKEINFSYTLNRRARLAYQLVYEQNGTWQFDHPQLFEERETPNGISLPGRKQRTLSLQNFEGAPFGYVLFYILAVDEDSTIPLYTALLSVQAKNEEMQVKTRESFSPVQGQELPIMIEHEKPCSLTVIIRNGQGETVSVPWVDLPSRPQHIAPAGSVLYWDGRDQTGETVPNGIYSVQVQATSGGQTTVAFSGAFTVE